MHFLESPKRLKWMLSLYPPLWGTGIWVRHVADDFRQIVVTMSPHFYNRNAFGAHFGGSLAAMTDPFLALMLIRILGPDYRVVDAETHIRFVQPARGKVEARFVVSEEVLAAIRAATAGGDKHFETFEVEVRDESGETVVTVAKKIYVRLRRELRPGSGS